MASGRLIWGIALGTLLVLTGAAGALAQPAQQVQVRQIAANHHPQFQVLRAQLRDAREQFAARHSAPAAVTADDAALLMDQIGQLRDQLGREALQVALELRAILTAEQLARPAQVRARLHDLRAEMRALLGGER